MDYEDDTMTPKPSMLRGLQNKSWTVSDAISELVDNSLGSGRGNAKHVWIDWDPKRRVLGILDDGRGLDRLSKLFQLGATVGRSPSDIGEYGMGGTWALLWLASRITGVWTLRDGMVARYGLVWPDVFRMEDWPDVPTIWTRANGNNTPKSLFVLGQGTYIELVVPRTRKVIANNVRRDLSSRYAPALRNGKVLRWRMDRGEYVQLSDPMQRLDSEIPIDLTVELEVEDGIHHFNVSGAIGSIEELPASASRVHVSYAHRVITSTRDCFRSDDGSRSYPGVGITGWIHLDDSWQGYLATTKDRIHDESVWDALMGALFTKIEHLLKSRQDESRRLLLDNIALDLQRMFNGSLSSDTGLGNPNPDGSVVGPGEEIHAPSNGDETVTPRPKLGKYDRDPDSEKRGQDRTISELKIIDVSDEEAEQKLCYSYVVYRSDSSISVDVYVNRDHQYVIDCLEEKPINRKALAALVSARISDEIADHAKIVKVWFRRDAARLLQLDRSDRVALIMRLLVDRFKAPA